MDMTRPFTAFELILISESCKGLLGKIYQILITSKPVTSSAKSQWDRDLRTNVPCQELVKN